MVDYRTEQFWLANDIILFFSESRTTLTFILKMKFAFCVWTVHKGKNEGKNLDRSK